MMDTEIAEFRRLVSTLDRPYRASPYPLELRKMAVEIANSLRKEGVGHRAIARRLGIRSETLEAWLRSPRPKKRGPKRDAPKLRRVVVEEPRRSEIVLRSAAGFVVEGLSVGDLGVLLRSLT
jgi:hypothetical protein